MQFKVSQKQLNKIQYESMLLRMSTEQLYIVAPHLFHEGVTSANTKVIENDSRQEQLEALAEEFKALVNTEDYNEGNYYGYA